MSKEESKVSKIALKEVESSKKGKITISKELMSQISAIHYLYPGKEWSGVLVYSVDKGNPYDEEDFECTAQGVYLLDLGSPAYTEYDLGEDIIDVNTAYPKIMTDDWKTGHLHTHHDMNAYFSGTDTDELKDNVGNYDFYMSLIVNYKEGGSYVCKAAYMAEVESKIQYTNRKGKNAIITTQTEEVMMTVKMDIVIQSDTHIIEQYNALKKKNAEASKKSAYKGNSYGYWNHASREWVNPNSGSQAKINFGEKQLAVNPYNFEDVEEVTPEFDIQEVKSMFVKTLAGDPLCEEGLEEILTRLNKEHSKEEDADEFVDDTFESYYDAVIPVLLGKDTSEEENAVLIETMINLLDSINNLSENYLATSLKSTLEVWHEMVMENIEEIKNENLAWNLQ